MLSHSSKLFESNIETKLKDIRTEWKLEGKLNSKEKISNQQINYRIQFSRGKVKVLNWMAIEHSPNIVHETNTLSIEHLAYYVLRREFGIFLLISFFFFQFFICNFFFIVMILIEFNNKQTIRNRNWIVWMEIGDYIGIGHAWKPWTLQEFYGIYQGL